MSSSPCRPRPRQQRRGARSIGAPLAALWLCATLPLAGCLATSQRAEALERDLRNQRLQLATLKRTHEEDHARLTARVSMLTKRAEELSEQLLALDASAHRGTTDITLEVTDLKRALAQLQGEIELQGNRLDKAEGGLRVLAQPSAAAPPGAEPVTATATASAAAAAPTTGSTGAPAAANAGKPPKGHEELLTEAKQALAAKQWDSALKLYNAVRLRWPETGGVADRASLGAGLALAGLGEHRKAIIEFNRILERFPKGEYADDALFEIAQAFIALGYKDDAAAFLDELVARHPSSALRGRAREQLKELKKGR